MCSIENQPGGARVLVVDDSLVNLLVAEAMLKERGVAIDTASSAQDALSKARTTAYGLILMDIRMAGTDGIAAARQIRSLGGHNLSVPIVALTADQAAHSREASLAAGMNDFIAKPLELETLDDVLHHWCGISPRLSSADRDYVREDSPVIDPEVFAKLRAGISAESFRVLVSRFSQETPLRMVCMRAAAAMHDHDAISREAHTIKSAAALFGARPLEVAAAKVERTAKRRQDCAELIMDMVGLVGAVCAWLDHVPQLSIASETGG